MQEASPQQWFAGAQGRSDGERLFMKRLRSVVSEWHEPDLDADATASLEVLQPLLVTLDVPSLPIDRRVLQVAYWDTGTFAAGVAGPVLQGCWGDAYLMDDYAADDADCLTVVGVEAPVEQFAQWAAQWMRHQLRRPVMHKSWTRAGKVVGQRWYLGDGGEGLSRQGSSWRPHLPGTVVETRHVRGVTIS